MVSFGQDASRADSLKQIYLSDENRRTDQKLLSSIATHEINPDSIIKYVELLIDVTEMDSLLLKANMHKAAAYRLKGEYNEALESAFEAMSIAHELGDRELIGIINITIANIYSENQDRSNASLYFKTGIDFLRKTQDSLSLAKALFNAADNYLQIEKLDSALIYTQESELIFKNLHEDHYRAYSLGNLGFIYFKKGDVELATRNIEKAISGLETLGDETAITEYLLYLAEIKMDQGEYQEANILVNKSLEMADELGLKKDISEANLKLSQIAEYQQDHEASLRYFKSHVALRDSIHNLESIQQMAGLRTDFEVSQKQLEVDLLNTEKRTQRIIMYALGLVLLLTAIYYRRIVKEKSRSDLLLLNILPTNTAKELKDKGKVEARKFEAVTV
ncbi:MAG: adenylate/guanylate cyclase domain-containing protein, partial [Lutimonas sp.]